MRTRNGGLKLARAIALTSLAAVAAISFLGSSFFGRRKKMAKTPGRVPFPDGAPANPDATPGARQLLARIAEISGRFMLTGQQNFIEDLSKYSDRIHHLTGRYPTIFGQDFGFSESAEAARGRASMIGEAIRQHRNGAVIALTWHAPRPTGGEHSNYEKGVLARLTHSEWNDLLTPGTQVHRRWVEQVDVVAGYLRELQVAGVPVLFRPYHEMNGVWFWWGGRPGERGSSALYRQIYDRYVNEHQLNNLVWVWNVNSPGASAGRFASYFPGAQYVDVVTMDNYGRYRQKYYDDLLTLAGTKPIALAEVGALPTLAVLGRQPRWAYFTIWRGFAEEANTQEQLHAMFHAPKVLNRGDAPVRT